MPSEAATHADFRSVLRYAQCWEDADVLLAGLDVQPGDVCLSIASAGENTLSLLTRDPARVIAVDLNPAQIAALELRVAAFRALTHAELLELVGSRPSARRAELYRRCRDGLSAAARAFWDGRAAAVASGVGGAGKFEEYFRLFRTRLLPFVHSRRTVCALFEPRDRSGRERFYADKWDTFAWRLLFRVFFSRTVLGRLGRDPSFFRYVEDDLGAHLRERVRHAFVELDPSANPYLAWIFTGEHPRALPHALRIEHFDAIRSNLGRLEWHCAPIEELPAGTPRIDRANLSNIFEYLSPENTRSLLGALADRSNCGARVAYWNMMVPRRGADHLPDRLRTVPDLSARLLAQDKAFFYRDFVVEEVVC